MPDSALAGHLRHGDTLGACSIKVTEVEPGVAVLLDENDKEELGLTAVVEKPQVKKGLLSKVKDAMVNSLFVG